MPLAPHAKLIQQILDQRHISNLAEEDEECQLEIYRLALCKIKEQVGRYLPRNVPHDTIINAEEALNEFSLSLVTIGRSEIGELFQVRDEILPRVNGALSSASQAIKIYEKERKKSKKGNVLKEELPQAYDNHVIDFRQLIIELHDHWREG